MGWDFLNNPISHEGPVSTGVDYDPEVGGYVLLESSEVSNEQFHPSTLDEVDITQRLTFQEGVQPKNHNKGTYVKRILLGETGGDIVYPKVTTEQFSFGQLVEFADVIRRDQQMIAKDTPYTLTDKDISYTTRRLWPVNDQAVREYVSNFTSRTGYATDQELNLRVKIERSVVAVGDVPPATSVGQDVKQTPVNSLLAIRQIETLLDASGNPVTSNNTTPIYEYEFKTREEFTFPTYTVFESPAFERAFSTQQRRTLVTIKYKVRRGYSRIVKVRKKIKYFTAPPDYDTIYASNPIFEWSGPVDIVYNGAMFSFEIPQTLVDNVIFSVTPLTGDTYYRGIIESVSITSTVVPAATYISAIGNEKLVDVNIVPIDRRMFRLTETYVKIE